MGNLDRRLRRLEAVLPLPVSDRETRIPFTDAERLRILLERHQLATGSAKAAALLADWPNALQHFVKVVPGEYRRALTELEPRADAVAAE